MDVFKKLVFSIGIVAILFFMGGAFSSASIKGWYSSLNHPAFTPPDFVFSIVWSILYLCIGLSLFFMLSSRGRQKVSSYSYTLFAIQLFFNGIWSYLFFYMHSINLALIDIYLLLVTIILFMVSLKKSCRIALFLFVPYVLWVSFACILFTRLWYLN